MNVLVRILCLLGVADGLALMFSPGDWLLFWVPKMDKIAASRKWAVAFGLFEIGSSVWLLSYLLRCKKDR